MKTIGITGGVGAGKSLILNYLKDKYGAKVYLADDIANEIKLPGHECYEQIVTLLGNNILADDLTIDKRLMAEAIFKDQILLSKVNSIIHPAVKKYIIQEIEASKKNQACELFVFEAALLIEEHYDEILDELWYVYADKEVRAERLRKNRNYSDEKIQNIMKSQLSEEEFRRHCKFEINNNREKDLVYKQIDNYLEG